MLVSVSLNFAVDEPAINTLVLRTPVGDIIVACVSGAMMPPTLYLDLPELIELVNGDEETERAIRARAADDPGVQALMEHCKSKLKKMRLPDGYATELQQDAKHDRLKYAEGVSRAMARSRSDSTLYRSLMNLLSNGTFEQFEEDFKASEEFRAFVAFSARVAFRQHLLRMAETALAAGD